jgi:uncharacterized protein YxeA
MKKIIILIITIVLVSAGIIIAASANRSSRAESDYEDLSQKEEVKRQAELVIDYGQESQQVFDNIYFENDETVFDVLKKQASKADIEVKTKEYDVGIFIESIGGRKNGTGGNYWTYYVNGKPAEVAADRYKLMSGDKIEFKFEKSPY